MSSVNERLIQLGIKTNQSNDYMNILLINKILYTISNDLDDIKSKDYEGKKKLYKLLNESKKILYKSITTSK